MRPSSTLSPPALSRDGVLGRLGVEVAAVSTFCRATLNYAPRDPALQLGSGAVEVEIRNARAADLPGWRDCGFELLQHASTVADWTDDEQIAAVHYAEAEALA